MGLNVIYSGFKFSEYLLMRQRIFKRVHQKSTPPQKNGIKIDLWNLRKSDLSCCLQCIRPAGVRGVS
jgi:hypothetical protein